MAAPDPGAVDAVHQGPVPAEPMLEVADASLRAGAPFDQPAEPAGVLSGLAGTAGLALARDRDPLHAEGGQLLVDGGLAIAAVCGDRCWDAAGAGRDPRDGRGQQGASAGLPISTR
jgi:hypothetical protein